MCAKFSPGTAKKYPVAPLTWRPKSNTQLGKTDGAFCFPERYLNLRTDIPHPDFHCRHCRILIDFPTRPFTRDVFFPEISFVWIIYVFLPAAFLPLLMIKRMLITNSLDQPPTLPKIYNALYIDGMYSIRDLPPKAFKTTGFSRQYERWKHNIHWTLQKTKRAVVMSIWSLISR